MEFNAVTDAKHEIINGMNIEREKFDILKKAGYSGLLS